MAEVFGDGDSLLRQVGMVTLYFHLFRATAQTRGVEIERRMLERFEGTRAANRQLAENSGEADSSVNTELLEFDNHSQTPNDAYALRTRLEILLRYLSEEFGLEIGSEVFEREVAPERRG